MLTDCPGVFPNTFPTELQPTELPAFFPTFFPAFQNFSDELQTDFPLMVRDGLLLTDFPNGQGTLDCLLNNPLEAQYPLEETMLQRYPVTNTETMTQTLPRD